MRYHVESIRNPALASVWAGIDEVAVQSKPAPQPTRPPEQAFPVAMLVEQLGFGVFVVDAAGQVQLLNRLGCEAIAAAAHLFLRGGLLGSADRAEAAALRAALIGAASGRRCFVRIAGRGGVQPSVVAVVPCGESGLCPALATPGGGVAEQMVALIFERPAEPAALTVTLFAQTYRITPAEQRVLSALCDGHAVNEIAKSLGSATATVRCHVRSLLEKTGCANLRALTCRVANLPALAPMDFSGFATRGAVLHS